MTDTFGSHSPTSTHCGSRGGSRWKFDFPNGFGASVVNDGYGGDAGLFELGVLDRDGRLTYDTPVTDDVLGYLTESDVAEALDLIAALPAEVTP